MRNTLLTGAVLLAATSLASAADFRALDFDAPCENLPALEAALGSSAYEGRLPSGFQFAFRGRELDRDVVFGYACQDGRFYRGAYMFDAKDEADAAALYRALKQRMVKERGAPSYDFASREHRQKMEGAGATLAKVDTMVSFWNDGHSEAHASVGEPSPTRPGWRVSLSFTSEKSAH